MSAHIIQHFIQVHLQHTAINVFDKSIQTDDNFLYQSDARLTVSCLRFK